MREVWTRDLSSCSLGPLLADCLRRYVDPRDAPETVAPVAPGPQEQDDDNVSLASGSDDASDAYSSDTDADEPQAEMLDELIADEQEALEPDGSPADADEDTRDEHEVCTENGTSCHRAHVRRITRFVPRLSSQIPLATWSKPSQPAWRAVSGA